jgi:phytoene dehydrogenase-like protein
MIHVSKYLSSDSKTDPKSVEPELEEFLDLVQPGWREVLVERCFLPNITIVSSMTTAAQGGLSGRAGPEVPGIRNLYVAGDWVGPDGWLSDASRVSGKRAAELILRAGDGA